MPNTLSTFAKSVIDRHIDEIRELRSFKKIGPFLKAHGVDISQQALYSYLNPTEVIDCADATFVSYSVGYKSCKRGCTCYVDRLSKKMAAVKASYTADQRAEISQRRAATNRQRHGVDSVFKLPQVKQQIKDTKLERHGDQCYNNRQQAHATAQAVYGVDNPAQSPDVQQRIRDTNLSRYGAATPFESDEIQQRARQTLLANYGVDVTFKSSEISAKIDATNIERYGTTNPAASDAVRDKISQNLRATLYDRMVSTYTDLAPLFTKQQYLQGISQPFQCRTCQRVINAPIINGQAPRCLTCLPYSVSVFEQQVRDYVASVYSGPVEYNVRNIIPPYELDIYFPELKFGIECNGVYRHTEVSGNKPRNYHLNKTEMCQAAGVSLLHITDHMWQHRTDVVKSVILHRLGRSERYLARHGTVRRIYDADTVRCFLENNHLQGYTRASTNYGLYIGDELMAVMTFARPRYSKEDYEIIRFCSKSGTSIAGASGKLLAKFKVDMSPGSIITYADRSYGNSSFYGLLGFTYSHSSGPGYTYYRDGVLHNRMQFQKHKLPGKLPIYDSTKTEWENMQANGYDRIWDCGVSVWKWAKP